MNWHKLWWIDMNCHELLWIVMNCHYLSWNVMQMPWTIINRHELSDININRHKSSRIVMNFNVMSLLADPGEARGCSTNSLVINWLIDWVSHPFPPTALRRRHAQIVRDRASNYKIDYLIVIKSFLNPEGHQNPISGSKVTAILLKGDGFGLLVELQRWRVCDQQGYPI